MLSIDSYENKRKIEKIKKIFLDFFENVKLELKIV